MIKQSKPRKIFSEEMKLEIMEFEKNNTISDTCKKFDVSKYTINKWKGWVRKNASESNKRWYSNNGKEYYSDPLNKQKHLESSRKRRKNFPTEGKERSKIYNSKCRFKKLAGYANRTFIRKNKQDFYVITAGDLWKIAKKQRLICPLTGIRLNASNMSVDHIIPISKGGTNHPSNIRLVQKWVNIMLQDKTDEEFFLMCRTITTYQESIS
jgi:hypothetical protein